jgi:hypothetical protein
MSAHDYYPLLFTKFVEVISNYFTNPQITYEDDRTLDMNSINNFINSNESDLDEIITSLIDTYMGQNQSSFLITMTNQLIVHELIQTELFGKMQNIRSSSFTYE